MAGLRCVDDRGDDPVRDLVGDDDDPAEGNGASSLAWREVGLFFVDRGGGSE
jgi:hypothetical protein